MKCIAYTRSDGGVSVVHPVADPGMTEEEALARARKDVPAEALNVLELDRSLLPPSREKRWAWTIAGGLVVVDIAAPVPPEIARARRIAELRMIRQSRPWTLPETQEMLDILLGL